MENADERSPMPKVAKAINLLLGKTLGFLRNEGHLFFEKIDTQSAAGSESRTTRQL